MYSNQVIVILIVEYSWIMVELVTHLFLVQKSLGSSPSDPANNHMLVRIE